MVVISVTYPATPGTQFDLDYYREKHIPLVNARWGAFGLTGAEFWRGTGARGGGPAGYHMVALLHFESEEAFGRAGAAHGREIMGDIKNFTDVKPVVQFNAAFP